MNENQQDALVPDIISPAEIVKAQESAAIDIAVSTANKYPRSIDDFRAKLQQYGTADEDTAAACFYVKPVGGGEVVRGPSVRLAELVVATYKNIQAGARIIAEDQKIITAQGICWDMESNARVSIEVSRSILTRQGRRYSAPQVEVAKSALCKIAYRNAVFSVIPMAIAKAAIEEIRKVGRGDEITLSTRVTRMLDYFRKQNVTVKALLAFLKKKSSDDIDMDDLETLRGIINAVDSDEITYKEAFAVEEKKADPLAPGKHEPAKKDKGKSKAKEEPAKPAKSPEDAQKNKLRGALMAYFSDVDRETRMMNINVDLERLGMKPVKSTTELTLDALNALLDIINEEKAASKPAKETNPKSDLFK